MPTDRLRGIVAHQPVTLYCFQQEKATRLESLAHSLKHFLILVLVLQVAKGGRIFDFRFNLELNSISLHVGMYPASLKFLSEGFPLEPLEKDFAQILTSHLVAAPGKRNG